MTAKNAVSILEVHDGPATIKINLDFKWRQKVGTKTDILARALGRARRKQELFVIDATAGLCRDSLHLLALGCKVVAIERNEILFRAFQKLAPPENFEFIHADAAVWLKQFLNATMTDGNLKRPDIVFLDPMFPESKKSAAVGKETRVLQLLEKPPTPNEELDLLSAARSAAINRVIVKRPKRAPFLGGQTPTHQFAGKAVRFDVYVVATT